MKHCPKCNEDKDESEFYKSNKNKDGLYCYCKSCHKAVKEKSNKAYMKKNRAKYREYSRIYNKEYYKDPKNKERKAELCKEYRKNNPERFKEYGRKYYKQKKELENENN
jgi:hypothetical protein